jgi:mono/diheme cytochrome c family protein
MRHTATLSLVLTLLAPALAAQEAKEPGHPTFTEHVAAIVFAHCAGCHRSGEAAPFPLTSYEEVKKHGRTIAKVTKSHYMPPWHPEPGFASFQGENRLTDAQVATLATWVQQEMPEGPKAALPSLPHFPEGWQLGEPDLVVSMARAFAVPASGPDLYRNFVIPLNLPEERWVTAIEVRPSARSVLHHILFFVDEQGEGRQAEGDQRDGQTGFRGMRPGRMGSLGGWAVGGMPEPLPDGLAMRLPRSSDLVLQSHFHPSGKREEEKTTLGFHFAKAPPKRSLAQVQLPPFFGIAAGLDIPAGQNQFLLKDRFELPCDVDAVSVGGHAHMLARTMRMQAELPGGGSEPLLSIRNWDFNWQNRYTYRSFVRLPKGSVITAEIVYDNSADNPANPNSPPRRVRWGRESTDEMGSITLLVTPADEADRTVLLDAIARHQTQGVVSEQRMQQIQKRIQDMIRQWDKDGDGKVSREELPPNMRRMFEMLDTDHDGFITMDDFKDGKGLAGLIPGLGGGDLGGPAGKGAGGKE